MKRFFRLMLLFAVTTYLTSCFGGNPSNTRVEDDKYWESISREQALKDAGMDGAAAIERKARQEYMQGGGYTAPDGSKQVHYQGSQEQKSDLEMIDAYFNKHGWD